ncbi:MAG: 3-demethylubiquinone-9 3-O-methyltransferase, partial [Magnetococcales bacterium]|nr:3-demethylubiquinone-9 3-O-methyltransferase [Magnetococcales bacterium]
MSTSADPKEIEKFEQMAHDWWQPDGKFKPLHDINPIRVDYIVSTLAGSPGADLGGMRLLDIGCGGGLLSEAMYDHGAQVTALDQSPLSIGAAQAHQKSSGSTVDYRLQSLEELAAAGEERFDAILTMEIL